MKIFYGSFFILVVGFLCPQNFSMPVEKAGYKSYSQQSFWAYPWGESVTHKGVDIFAPVKTPVHSSTYGIVIGKGVNRLGGNYVKVLGPKWRVHYYAHLDSIKTRMFAIVNRKSVIGTVGTTGNAKGKLPHLHYSIKTIIPYPWNADHSIQGKRKMFYLNPINYLNETCRIK